MSRGFFEIGIYNTKTPANLGTLWRSAYQLGASGIFTIGKRYPSQCTDTLQTWRHVPLRHFADFDSFFEAMPFDAPLVGIEMGGDPLQGFTHRQRAIYLLGAEDHGLPPSVIERCHARIALQSVRTESYNVAVAGSLVMYDRATKLGTFA